jgi:hypothetical protein
MLQMFVPNQNHASTRFEHADPVADSDARMGQIEQQVAAGDDIERIVWQGGRLGVAEDEGAIELEVGGALSGNAEHSLRKIQAHAFVAHLGIEASEDARTGAYVQDLQSVGRREGGGECFAPRQMTFALSELGDVTKIVLHASGNIPALLKNLLELGRGPYGFSPAVAD